MCRFHVPCDLRQHRAVELFERHVGQHAVGQHAGRVNHAAQRRVLRNLLERLLERRRVRHVALQRDDIRALAANRSQAAASTSADGARRANSAIVPAPCSASHSATRNPSAPSPPVTRYVPSLRTTESFVVFWLPAPCSLLPALHRHDDLADVLPLRHVAEGVDRALGFESREHQRRVVARLEKCHHFGEQRADVVRPLPQHAVQVDREIREIVLERQQADHPVLIDVGLADFEEPAIRPQDRQALGDRLAGQRIEHDVDALAIRVGENLLGERRRPAAVDVLHAERPQEFALLVAAGRGENFRAEMLRDLNRRQADAAGARVDQQPLARLHLRQPHQAVVGREERDRNRAGFVVIDRLRLGHQRVLGRAGMRRERIRHDAEHFVAHLEPRDTFADRRDDARRLDAQRHDRVLDARIQAERLEHVAEIEPRGADFDFDLARLRRLAIDRHEPQCVERAWLA